MFTSNHYLRPYNSELRIRYLRMRYIIIHTMILTNWCCHSSTTHDTMIFRSKYYSIFHFSKYQYNFFLIVKVKKNNFVLACSVMPCIVFRLNKSIQMPCFWLPSLFLVLVFLTPIQISEQYFWNIYLVLVNSFQITKYLKNLDCSQ